MVKIVTRPQSLTGNLIVPKFFSSAKACIGYLNRYEEKTFWQEVKPSKELSCRWKFGPVATNGPFPGTNPVFTSFPGQNPASFASKKRQQKSGPLLHSCQSSESVSFPSPTKKFGFYRYCKLFHCNLCDWYICLKLLQPKLILKIPNCVI